MRFARLRGCKQRANFWFGPRVTLTHALTYERVNVTVSSSVTLVLSIRFVASRLRTMRSNKLENNDLMTHTRSISQLFHFMTVFGIDRFQVLKIEDGRIHAMVGWPNDGRQDYDAEEEVQEIVWQIDFDPELNDALQLMDNFACNGLISIDKIDVAKARETFPSPLKDFETKSVFDKLCSIRVDMVDAGVKTDFFYLHT